MANDLDEEEKVLKSPVEPWRRLALQTLARTDLKEVEQKLYEASLEEVAAGYLKRPYSKEQLDEQFGANNWLFTYVLH